MLKESGHTHLRIKERLGLQASKANEVQRIANLLYNKDTIDRNTFSNKFFARVENKDKHLGYALFKKVDDNKNKLTLATFYRPGMKPKGLQLETIKLAAKKKEMPLKYYQNRVIQRISDPNQSGLVVAHGTGTGKTLTSVGAYNKLGLPAEVIVPAALKNNYNKELNKWIGGVPKDVNITSQQLVARDGLPNMRDKLLIVDEAHKAREQQSQLLRQLKDNNAKKRLLLTATPVFNHPREIAPLINLASGKQLLPEDKAEFERQFIDYKEVAPPLLQRLFGVKPGLVPTFKNDQRLKRIFKKYVDYHQNEQQDGFPSFKEQVLKVPMGQNQMDIYKSIMGQAPWWVRWKVKAGLPPGKGELDTMRAFLSGVRQVSNTNRGFIKNVRREEATKIQEAFKFLKSRIATDPNYKAVVYSNYLQSGLAPYKDMLTKNNIPYGEFSGDVNPRVRDDLVKQYNENKLRALLISSAGAEGLDLKGTRLVQILEPHFNEEKEKQITGRAIRYGSHAGLPPSQRNVLVQRYLAQPQRTWLDKVLGRSDIKGADEYIRSMAMQKSLLNRQLQQLMRKAQGY